MSHSHAGHDHTHGMAKQTLRLAFFLTLIILAAELGGGIISHSLALLSDAGHVFTDIFALGLAWFATAHGRETPRMIPCALRINDLAASCWGRRKSMCAASHTRAFQLLVPTSGGRLTATCSPVL